MRGLLSRITRGERKPHILLVPDQPGWAFDFLADDLARFASSQYRFTKMFKHNLPDDEDYRRFDTVYFFWWGKTSIKDAERLGIPSQRCMSVVSSHNSWLKKGWTPKELGRVLRFYPAVGAISAELYRLISAVHPKVFLTRHGIDPEMFHETRPIPSRRADERLIVGWAGSRKHPSKGFAEFIEPAVSALEGVELRVATRAGEVHAAGRTYERREMVSFYNDIDVFLCASEHEGAPLPVLEAGACGRPVISTAVGIVPELIEDGANGLIVEREVDAFVRAMATLRDDRSRAQQMGRRLQTDVLRDWTWSVRIREYVKMFDHVLRRARRQRHKSVSAGRGA